MTDLGQVGWEINRRDVFKEIEVLALRSTRGSCIAARHLTLIKENVDVGKFFAFHALP